MKRRRLSLTVAALACLGLLSASCAPAEPPPPVPKPTIAASKVVTPSGAPTASPIPPAPTPKPAAGQPQYGGTLTMAAHASPPNLDVHDQAILALFGAVGPAYSGILQYDPFENDKVVGDLAERWESSSDGATYTFFLRKGVKWHDGMPFSSTDAKFSLQRMEQATLLKSFVTGIKAIETPDADTLKVILVATNPAFPSMIAHGRTLMVPKHVVEAKGNMRRDVVGTGPYKLKEYDNNVGTKLVKNTDYFVKGPPYLDGIVSHVIRDVSTRLAAFRTARVKMMGMPPDQPLTLNDAEVVKKEMPTAIQPYRALNGWGVTLNHNRPPWTDVRVRRAAFLALDRQKALDVVAQGVGDLTLTTIYGEWAIPKTELLKMPGYRQPKDQDIAEAKRLLAEAGYDAGFKTSINVRFDYAMYEKVATFAREQLARIGIDLQLNMLEYASFVDRRDRLAFDTMCMLMPASIADPGMSERQYVPSRGATFSTIEDAKLNDLYKKQTSAMDINERKKLVLDIQYRLAEIIPSVFLFWADGFLGMAPEVRGYKPGIGTHNNYKLQDVWLAK